MRFMIIVKASKDSEAGVMPPEELLAAMAAYHEELQKAGVLLDGSGLQPSAKGWRIRYDGSRRTVIDGPFAESKELIAGYTLIQVKSLQEAIGTLSQTLADGGGHGLDDETHYYCDKILPAMADQLRPSGRVLKRLAGRSRIQVNSDDDAVQAQNMKKPKV